MRAGPPNVSPHTSARAAIAAALLSAAVAQAQESRGALTIVPTLSITQSFTDNTEFSNTDKRSEAITTVSPGVRMSSRSGRLQGSLDYALNLQAYANDNWRGGITNTLAAAFTAEVIQQNATVDVRAGITQQSISAFGVRTVTPQFTDRNRTEVRTLNISPVLRGRLGDLVNAEARMNWTKAASTSGGAADSSLLTNSLRLFGQRSAYGWSADVSDSTSDFENGRETGNRRVNLGATYSPNPDLQFSVRAGRETDTVRSLESQTSSTYGAGVTWTPSPRTTVNAQLDRRYFGNGHSVQISHRMARSIYTFSDSRDTNNGAVSDRTLQFATAYDTFFTQLAGVFPDPALRDLVVRELLRQQGLFIGRAVSLQRRQDASVALQGVRTTLLLSAYRSTSRRLDQASSASDDLSLADGLRQQGYSLSATYTASSTTSVSLAFNSSTNTGNNNAVPGGDNELRNLTASLSGRLARRVSYSLSLRHSTFDSTLRPYTENGGQIYLSFQF